MKAIAVIPTYNEAENLPRLVGELFALGLPDLELVVVDDSSPDGTGSIAARLAEEHTGRIHLIQRPEKLGLGTAYLAGFRLALERGAEVILQMDADFSHSPSDVPRLISALESYDVAVGSRYAPGARLAPDWGFLRRALSWGANGYARAIAGLRVRDATAGFKGFRRGALEALNQGTIRSRGYAFQIEIAYLCQEARLRVVEVPIHFRERFKGASKMSWRIVGEAAWRAWQLRWGRRG